MAQPHRREDRLDRVGRPQVLPVFCGEVVEHEELLAVARRGLPIALYQRPRVNQLRMAAGLEPIGFLE